VSDVAWFDKMMADRVPMGHPAPKGRQNEAPSGAVAGKADGVVRPVEPVPLQCAHGSNPRFGGDDGLSSITGMSRVS
jgi:hypothetical protein